jgi:hypothetical protein
VLVDPAGKVSAIATGSAPVAGGTCVVVQDLGAGAIEALSVSGAYRLRLESPTGAPSSAEPRGRLRVTVRSASGGQAPVVDGDVRLVLLHAEMGAGHGFDPNGVATTPEAGGFVLDPIAWPMAGMWLVTAKLSGAGVNDQAYFAVTVK